MTDITFKEVPEGIVKRVKNAVMNVVAENIQREELKPSQDKLDSARTKVEAFAKDNDIALDIH